MDFPISLKNEPSLYVHIPFCSTCCSYCAFYSEPRAQWNEYQDAYVKRLLSEIEIVEKQVPGFETIFIGGGNPGSLDVEQLVGLLSAAQVKKKSREVTIEMNPETFTEAFFPLFEQKLVTRLSMGIQSMDDTILGQLQRNARRSDNLRAITLAKKAKETYGIDLSFDLMVALPGQTTEMAVADYNELLNLVDVDHLSLYCLTVEEGTELKRQVSSSEIEVMNDDQQMQLLRTLWDVLANKGFEHYEVSNFSKKGKQCLHNQHYWKLDTYIGLGSSASSLVTVGNDYSHFSQDQSLAEYAMSAVFSGYEEEKLGKNEQLEEYLMMALRTHSGIDKAFIDTTWNIHFDTFFAKKVATLDASWYKDTKQFFTITENGYMVLDEIILRMALAIV